MSAECFKHGCDLVYPAGNDTMVGVCQVCERDAEIKRLRDDYRGLLLAIRSVQHEAFQEYLNSSEDGKRTIDAARTWVRANRHRTAVDEDQG